jgi:homocysteine S-methyltransferase
MDTKDLWVLDGGMGRELARRGAPFRQPEWSALALMEAPETVREVHQAYVASGARVITTNSYALVPFHIGDARFVAEGEGLAALAGQLAREVADEQPGSVQVAGSLPPLFGSYRADLFDSTRAG